LAALLLNDGNIAVSAENIITLLAASNNTVASYWPTLFASFINSSTFQSSMVNANVGLVAVPITGISPTCFAVNTIIDKISSVFFSSSSCQRGEDDFPQSAFKVSDSLGRLL
jgi:hypothetical protein